MADSSHGDGKHNISHTPAEVHWVMGDCVHSDYSPCVRNISKVSG